MSKKREIPPIVDYVDERRVPYDIMKDPKYNGEDTDPNSLWNRMQRHRVERSRWEKIRGYVVYRIWRHRLRRWFRPSTYIYLAGGRIARMRRGWGEWDLDQYTPHSIDYLVAACDWHATKSWTLPVEYVDDPSWPENDSPDRGREVEGYREDLMKIKSGMLHVKLALIGGEEKCTCCGEWCRGWGDWKTEGCPIVTEAWELYTKLFWHMWD